MKRIHHSILTVLLLLPISLSAMTTDKQQPLSLETVKKLFEQTISAIVYKQTEQHFKKPRTLNKKKRRVSSYSPSNDPEWELVVAD